MSPEMFQRKIEKLYRDMNELYEAGSRSRMLRGSLFHLNRATLTIRQERMGLGNSGLKYVNGIREYVPRAIEVLMNVRRPLTLQDLLGRMQEAYPDLLDVQYRTFHPCIRNEVFKPHLERRLAECGYRNGKRLYGLPYWKSARPYVAGVKNGCV